MLPLTRSRNRARFFGIPFSPSALFQGGTVAGAWYDPSDLSTMFDTSAGTTPVAMPGQGAAVPVGLMLDKSQGLVLGSEEDPGFASYTDVLTGTWLPSGANYVFTDTVGGQSRPGVQWPSQSLAAGWYQISVVVASITGATQIRMDGVGATDRLLVAGTNTFFANVTSLSRPRFRIEDLSTTIGDGFALTSVSVRELPGNHAISFNNTTARPELRARVNLLVATATLSTQSVTTQATSYTLSFTGAGSITLSGTATGSYSAGAHTITCTAGTLTLTVSGTVTTADLRPANFGALLPAYQAVVDANTYDTNGFPLYLRFDGIDDSMYTPANLNLSGTDKVAVFAGVRKLSSLVNFYSELTTNAFTLAGGFYISSSLNTYAFVNQGSFYEPSGYVPQISNVLACSYDLSKTTLATEIIPRIDGVVTQTGGFGSGSATGNFANAPLFIGARNNASFFLNGHLHSLIIAGSAVSAGNISATEQWVAGKTGITI